MKHNRFARFVSLLLALLTCAAALAACSGNTPDTTADTTAPAAATTAAVTEPEITADPAAVCDLDYAALNYGGTVFTIATTKSKVEEWIAEEQTGEILNDAVVKRNMQVAEDLGIEFAYIQEAQSGGNCPDMKTALTAAIKAGDQYADVMGPPSYYTPSWILDGLLLNFEAVENSHLDFSKIWWLSGHHESQKLQGKSYFLIGDLTPTVIKRLELIFLNTDLADTYLKNESKSLYDMVYDREWTWEKFVTLVNSCGEGASTGVYGCNLPCNSYSIDGLQAGFRIELAEQTDDAINVTINSERNVSIVEAMRNFYYQNASVLTEDSSKAFQDGTALFNVELALNAQKYFAAGVKYSLLPLPLWDADQEDYVSLSQDEYSALCIPANVGDRAEMITAVLEDLAYRSHDTIYMAMYENLYKTRYSESYNDSAMFDFIYQHVRFSFGAIYSYVLGEVKNCPRYMLYPASKNTAWTVNSSISASFKGLEKTAAVHIKKLMTALG